MLIRIDTESEISLYAQLMTQIMEGILRGELKDGDALPSVRSLSADLGVNMHTVNKSYHELEKKGLIEIRPKSGAVIRTHTSVPSQVEYNRLKLLLKPNIIEALVLGMEEEELISFVENIIIEVREG